MVTGESGVLGATAQLRVTEECADASESVIIPPPSLMVGRVLAQVWKLNHATDRDARVKDIYSSISMARHYTVIFLFATLTIIGIEYFYDI